MHTGLQWTRWPKRKESQDHKPWPFKTWTSESEFFCLSFLACRQTFVVELPKKQAVSDRHTVALRRENRVMVHEKPGRWSRKAGGRYSQCSVCMKLSVHEKAVVGSRWSLFAVVAEARFHRITRKNFNSRMTGQYFLIWKAYENWIVQENTWINRKSLVWISLP